MKKKTVYLLVGSQNLGKEQIIKSKLWLHQYAWQVKHFSGHVFANHEGEHDNRNMTVEYYQMYTTYFKL